MFNEGKHPNEDIFELDGVQVNEIVIVGRLINQVIQGPRVILEITDDTATCKIIFYKKDSGQPSALKDFQYLPNKYVKIYGRANGNNERFVIANSIHELKTFNEITQHFLSVFVMDQYRKKGALPEEKEQNATPSANTMTSSSLIRPQDSTPLNMSNNENQHPDVSLVVNAFKELQQVSKDIHVDDLKLHLAGRIDEMRLTNILNDLANEGTIYGSTDEFHYKMV